MVLWLAAAWAGSEVSLDTMTVDGLEMRAVTCTLQGFDLTWMLKLQQGLVDSKKAGDACVPKGAAIRVRWDWKGKGKAAPTVVKSSATAKQNACLTPILTLETAPLDASCELTLLYGEPAGARAAADAL